MVNRQNLSLIKTNLGHTISELSDESPVLLVFLRHFGCIFCKESLHDIGKKRKQIEEEGIKIILVHMADEQTASGYFKKYGLKNIEHVCDVDRKAYVAFGLEKGSFSQLFGLKTWIRGFELAATKQIFPSSTIGDGFQMPGIFLIKKSEIIAQFVHNAVADKPNYDNFIQNCRL